jgi:hypothetical protein
MTPAKARALGVRVGTLWNPSMPDDVRAAQKRADQARASLATALASSPPKSGDPAAIDTAVRGWNTLNSQVQAYVLEDPSIFWWTRDDQVKRGQGFETQIESYRQTFERFGSAMPPAPAPPPKQPGLLDQPLFGDLAETLKWAAIAFIAYKVLK